MTLNNILLAVAIALMLFSAYMVFIAIPGVSQKRKKKS